ncbi:DUF433 domain-containing protein [Chitinophaga sp. G-6-1-13]|uniref:DUF433 domain-containing protein n=1 Tax=Chitinophaga fulva TaxID=2728842 RepID=A0A848GLB7_9BACT|nr:DUF433 domain-containing protein [Chitinophaga fulva]NML37490.1 DUF433 domain-containing protein [Chitinophaga fulva]
MNIITRKANIGFGQPTVNGRRLTVFNVVSYAAHTDDITSYLNEFELSRDELSAAVDYCMDRRCGAIEYEWEQYCDGCILRTIADGDDFNRDDYEEIDGITFSKDRQVIFLGSLDEQEKAEAGVMGWVLAEEVNRRLDE